MDTSDNRDKSDVGLPGSRGPFYGGRRPSGTKTRLVIVDNDDSYRQGLKDSFSLEPDIEVIGEADSGQAAVQEAGRLKPDVVLIDLNMPGMDAMQTTRRITDAYTSVRVIVLTMHTDEEHLREARRAGASAYVMKDAGTDVLIQTVRDVMRGQTPLLQNEPEPSKRTPASPASRESSAPVLSGPATGYLITSNERAILGLLAEGLTNDEIAQQQSLQLYMVRTYIEEISRKLGLMDRDAVVQYARTHGFDNHDHTHPAS